MLERAIALLLSGALALAACGGGEARQATDATRPVIGLSTSLPIVWPESDDIAGMLQDDAPPHWALSVLREVGEVRPLDSLAAPGGALPLPSDAVLVMAQPWPLSPQENVALDDWVRGGGRVLLFADPMLTFESRFALGDRRRPQDVAMLSPILTRWGLELRFDEDQPEGGRVIVDGALAIPVRLSGTFAVRENPGQCVLGGEGLVAQCRIGRGQIVAIADAALLGNRAEEEQGLRRAALHKLLDLLTER